MVFGLSRPPITEDVADVIARDMKESEGHTPPSETPIAFIRRKIDPTAAVDMHPRVRRVLHGIALAMLVLVVVLLLR
ncbi:hypothetical protein OCK02_09385 [Rhizobium sp. TRM96647]|uniref:hypothetical protein n=1 Tax=unclassified Rhizobium TaxID=2613769 RepID=UPI0021E7CB68|nr:MULTISPECIES: hypothetical protein [unclassified Rhizobium]MCV3736416.1 hypothetical protein [Rhizobium sp. TRM96647]MCV3758785.1 hypothetical protein [Rhizobium sp. TRM96650]